MKSLQKILPAAASLFLFAYTSAFAAPTVSGTQSATFPPNNDNSARPGDTITYSGTIQNTGNMDATGVQLAEALDANTTFTANSVKLSPNSISHSYNAVGNTPLSVAAGTGLKVGRGRSRWRHAGRQPRHHHRHLFHFGRGQRYDRGRWLVYLHAGSGRSESDRHFHLYRD